MGAITTKNVTLFKRKALNVTVSNSPDPSFVSVNYAVSLQISELRAILNRTINVTYSANTSINSLTANQVVTSNIDVSYLAIIIEDQLSVTSDIDKFVKYSGSVNIDNLLASNTVQIIDTQAPILSVNTDFNFTNKTYDGVDVILIAQGEDNESLQTSLRYGLVAEIDINRYVDAIEQGPAFTNFRDIKTGAQLDSNGNVLSFVNAQAAIEANGGEDSLFTCTVIVWDDAGNYSQYNLKEIDIPDLEIFTFNIDQSELLLDIDQIGQLTLSNIGTNIPGNVEWLSLNESIVESLGDGRFKGIAEGNTGVRVTSLDDPTVFDTIPVTVSDLETIVDGEEYDFTVGGTDFVTVIYIDAVAIDSLSATVGTVTFTDVTYAGSVTIDALSESHTDIDLGADNGELVEYQRTFGGDNGELVEYATEGITNVIYDQAVDISGLVSSSVVQEQFVDVTYATTVILNAVLSNSEVADFQYVIEGEDNGELVEYVKGVIGEDDGELVEYAYPVVDVTYAANIIKDGVQASSFITFLNEIVDATYVGSVSIETVIRSITSISSLVVDVWYEPVIIVDGALTNVDSISLIITEIEVTYLSSVVVDSPALNASIDTDGPIQPTGNGWGLSVQNIGYKNWDIVLDSLPEDDTTPNDQLQYGLVIDASLFEIVNAQIQGKDYANYKLQRTGAQLSANSNTFNFTGADTLTSGQSHEITVVVWDEYNNTSSYNIIQATPIEQFLDVTYAESLITDSVTTAQTVQSI